MEQKDFLKIYFCLLTLLLTNISFSQTTLYSENFANQNNQGIRGSNTSDANTQTSYTSTNQQWSITLQDLNGNNQNNFTANNDWARVRQNFFEGRDLKGLVIWETKVIDIENYINVTFQLKTRATGAQTQNDTFVTEYKINNGNWVQAETNGFLNDNFSETIVSQTDISNGTTLQIRAIITNSGETLRHTIDDVLVQGFEVIPGLPIVSFDSPTTSITETESGVSVTDGIPVTISNFDSNTSVTITPTISSSSTAEAGDYILSSPLSDLEFTSEGQTLYIPIQIINNDVDYDDESIIFDIELSPNSTDSANIKIAQHTIEISDNETTPLIVISEINYNSIGADDEWIEIHNTSDNSVDISDWKIENTYFNFKTFTFPSNSTITSGAYITIAFGSDGDGSFNDDNPFTPNYTNITNNNGEAIATNEIANTNNTNYLSDGSSIYTLTKPFGGIVDVVNCRHRDLGASANNTSHDGGGLTLELVNPNLDNRRTDFNWQTSGINGGTPGYINASYWTGNGDITNWSDSNNWTALGAPLNDTDNSTQSPNVVIPAGLDNYPTITETININHILIEAGATLVSNESPIKGLVTYQKDLNASQWYFVASPVVGEIYNDDWITANSIASGTGNNRGISTYDNSIKDQTTDHWRYLQAGSSATFNKAQGYSIIRTSNGTVSFTGTGIYYENQTFILSRPDSNNNDSGSNNFNLVSNPFLGYLNLGQFLDINGENNSSVIEGATAYFWDGSQYITKLSGLDADYEIAPGQAFFVEAATDGAELTFNTDHISHSNNTSQKTMNNTPEITLNISDGNNNRNAKIYYINGASKGFDTGYDGKLFDGDKTSFSLFYDLVESDGYKYQIQSLPNEEYEKTVIPVGVNASANKEITFTAEATNLPSGLMVYLEDRENNTFTRLDETNTNYTVYLNNSSNGIGRFYLHTRSSALNTDNITLEGINIYATDKNTLTISGINSSDASIKIYNVLGKKVVETSFTSNGRTNINLPNLTTGIYIIQITTEKGKATKKIVLE